MNNTEPVQIYKCSTLWPLDMPVSHLITWAVVSSILSPIIIVSNTALIYSLYKTQQLTTITNKYILIMNISDLGVGIFVLPLVVVMICVKDTFRNCIFELCLQYFALLLAYFSFFLLMCISLDRYIHVTKLNKYNQFMNDFRMKVILAVSFVSSAGIACISTIFPSFTLQLALNLSDLIGISFMFCLYSMVLRKIATHTENFKRMLEAQGTEQSSSRETKREVSATKTIRFVLGALFLLYLPYNVCSAVWAYYKYDEDGNPEYVTTLAVATCWSFIFSSSNAAINAMIFAYGNSAIRRFLLAKFRRGNRQIVPEGAAVKI